MPSARELNDQGWKELLSEIRNGNVIPIIGSELSKINIDGEEKLLDEFLLNQLVNKNEIEEEVSDFTQLKYSREWKNIIDEEETCMQYEIKKLYQNLNLSPSAHIQKLLKIKEFKIILTTTFDNLIELALKDKYGKENVKILHYEIKTKYNDFCELDRLDENETILFYMFGKLGDLETSYVLTEDDLLKYMLNWINISSSPKNLINCLQDKYLLVLGCNYPNWLFKFFLHSIKYNIEKNTMNVVSKRSLVADFQVDDALNSFLSRNKTRFHNNPEAFIDELIKRYEHEEENENENRQANDIFISYAHEDEEVVSKIVNELKDNKISVWFDKNKDEQYGLGIGDKFDKKIKRNIISSKMFVPILSKNVIADRRFFRKEWSYAIEESKGAYKNYIFPLIIDDIDLNNDAIADEFKGLHTPKFDTSNIKDSLQQLIRLINKDKRISMRPL
jgi:hypothetical protein